jgi:hypothetical protein
MPVPVAVHVGSAFPRDHGSEMRWLQLRHMPLIDGVVGDAIKPYLAVRPWPYAAPFDGVVIVERLARREDVEHAGRAASAARVDAHHCVSPRHPGFGIDRLPCHERAGRAGKQVGMLRDQPVPHRFVMVLIHDSLAVRTERHNHWHQSVGLWAVDISPQDEPIVHRDLQVSFNHHVGSCVARWHAGSPGFLKRPITGRGYVN